MDRRWGRRSAAAAAAVVVGGGLWVVCGNVVGTFSGVFEKCGFALMH